MYSYLSAIVKPKGWLGRWVEADLSKTPLIKIYRDYRQARVTLTHTSLPAPVVLDMASVRHLYGDTQLTVSQWLGSLGNNSLPTAKEFPELRAYPAHYSDAWRAGYRVATARPGVHPEAQFPESEKSDLLLSKERTDYAHFYKHCLVTVNGFIHQTAHSPYGIYVTDGRKSSKIANLTQVGIISFEQVGAITPIPITESMLHAPQEAARLRDGVYVKLPQGLSGKTLLLVLGGYLHALDNTYQMVGEDLVKINFPTYPLPQKLFEARKYIDLATLELPVSPNNPTAVALEDIYSDKSLLAYLKLSQSFFLVVDAPELYVERHLLEKARLPGRWVSHCAPTLPLLKGSGKLEDYVSFEEDGQYVIACDDNMDVHYNFETTEWVNDPVIDETKSTTRPYSYSRGFFLEVGTER